MEMLTVKVKEKGRNWIVFLKAYMYVHVQSERVIINNFPTIGFQQAKPKCKLTIRISLACWNQKI